MNQRKTTRPKAQSIYKRIGEAPWGHIRKSWPEIVVVTQTPEATVRYEWIERPMPRNMMVDRPERVIVIDTVEDYMTVGHKIWEKQISARGGQPNLLIGLQGGLWIAHWRSPSGNPMYSKGFIYSRTSLPLSLVMTERLPPRSASFSLMDYKVLACAYIKTSTKEGCNPLLPNYVGYIGRKPVYEAYGPLESIDYILI
jgi:hypothetical protein